MPDAASTSATPAKWSPSLAGSLAGAILGGIVAFAVVNQIDPVFKMAELPDRPVNFEPDDELIEQYLDARIAYVSSNYPLDFGIIGACLGLAIGLLATSRRRLASGLSAGILGGCLGAVASYSLAISISGQLEGRAEQTLIQIAIYHFIVWTGISLGIGVGIALVQEGMGKLVQGVVTGLLSGALVAIAYPLVAAIVFVEANLLHLVPDPPEQHAVWMAIAAVVLGFAFWYGMRSNPPKTVEAN